MALTGLPWPASELKSVAEVSGSMLLENNTVQYNQKSCQELERTIKRG